MSPRQIDNAPGASAPRNAKKHRGSDKVASDSDEYDSNFEPVYPAKAEETNVDPKYLEIQEIIKIEYQKRKLEKEPQIHFQEVHGSNMRSLQSNSQFKHLVYEDVEVRKTFLYMPLPHLTPKICNKFLNNSKVLARPKALRLIKPLDSSELLELVLETSKSSKATTPDTNACHLDFGVLIHCSETFLHPCTVLHHNLGGVEYTRLRIRQVTVDIPQSGSWVVAAPHIELEDEAHKEEGLLLSELGLIKRKVGESYVDPFDSLAAFEQRLSNWASFPTLADKDSKRPMLLLGEHTQDFFYSMVAATIRKYLKRVNTDPRSKVYEILKAFNNKPDMPHHYHSGLPAIFYVHAVPSTGGTLNAHYMKEDCLEVFDVIVDDVRSKKEIYLEQKRKTEEAETKVDLISMLVVRRFLTYAPYKEVPKLEKQQVEV